VNFRKAPTGQTKEFRRNSLFEILLRGMANQTLMKNQTKLRERIERLEEEIQKLKWISVPKISKPSVVDMSRGILGSKFQKGVEYQRKMRKQWEQRMKKVGL